MEKEIARFLAEDIGTGDVTTDSIVPENESCEASIIAKEGCVIAGQGFSARVFRALDRKTIYENLVKDGETAVRGNRVARIRARTRAILTGERVALNILQRLSGIATATKQFADAVDGSKAKILDTRKTTPGLRVMEKHAVVMGGGHNHRFNLAEMALVKENHISIAGSIMEAVRRIRKRSSVPIEVEVKNMDELREAVKEGVERIMLDNWRDDEVSMAVDFVRIPIEVSGNMTIDRARRIARTGVDFISVGSVTHSFKSADLSLLID
jgi:nicotinate-nucleotide pyrophosphorylase (carboxylating)